MKNIANILISIGVAIGVFYGYRWFKGADFGENHRNTSAVILGISDYLNGSVPVSERSFEDGESGSTALMTARSYQYSSENVSIGHGYFTKFLVDGLQGGEKYDPDMQGARLKGLA